MSTVDFQFLTNQALASLDATTTALTASTVTPITMAATSGPSAMNVNWTFTQLYDTIQLRWSSAGNANITAASFLWAWAGLIPAACRPAGTLQRTCAIVISGTERYNLIMIIYNNGDIKISNIMPDPALSSTQKWVSIDAALIGGSSSIVPGETSWKAQ
jgi:hypothetical protein